MTAISKINTGYKLRNTMEDAFPTVDARLRPFGSRILVQLRAAATKTEGGLHLVENTIDTETDNTQIGKIVAIGPGAFRDRTTLELWPEGQWAQQGMFVRVPKYGREQWTRPNPKGGKVTFALFEDLQLQGEVTGDPLELNAFL